MKPFFLCILLLIISQQLFCQGNSFRKSVFIEHRKIFAKVHIGLSIGGNETVKTGFVDDKNEQIKLSTNSGSLVGFSLAYLINLKFDYLIGYDYQFSTTEKQYANGTSFFKRNAVYSILKYSPFIAYQSRLNIGIGVNSLIGSKIETKANIDSTKVNVTQNYKCSFGPIFLSEFEIYINRRVSTSISLKYNENNLKIKHVKLNNYRVSKTLIPADAREFESNCLFFQLALIINLF